MQRTILMFFVLMFAVTAFGQYGTFSFPYHGSDRDLVYNNGYMYHYDTNPEGKDWNCGNCAYGAVYCGSGPYPQGICNDWPQKCFYSNGIPISHHGTDYGTGGLGLPVYAVGPGRVLRRQNDCPGKNSCDGRGNYVELLHQEQNIITRYFHMEKGSVLVDPGDEVRCDTMLGKTGKTGYATGVHLHLEGNAVLSGNRTGAPVDLFQGQCNGRNNGPSYWANQGAYWTGLPADTCTASQNCTIPVGRGAPLGGEQQSFVDAYDFVGGKPVMGCATDDVRTNGFLSFSGQASHYQTFTQGEVEYPLWYGYAWAIPEPMYSKWASYGFNQNNILGHVSGYYLPWTSYYGTDFAAQQFEGGFVAEHRSGPRNGQLYETHGLIRVKWAQVGGWGPPLGIAISDERDPLPSQPTGRTGRVSDFEGGHIHYRWGDWDAYETHGDIDDLYVELGGTNSCLGFPQTDEFINSQGVPQSNFEGGYITTSDWGQPYTCYCFNPGESSCTDI